MARGVLLIALCALSAMLDRKPGTGILYNTLIIDESCDRVLTVGQSKREQERKNGSGERVRVGVYIANKGGRATTSSPPPQFP